MVSAGPQHFELAKPVRFARWRQTLAGVFDIAAEPNEIELFDGSIAAWMTNRVLLTEMKASAVQLVRSPQTISRNRLHHYAVTLLLAGSTAGAANAKEIDAEPGDVFFIDLSQPAELHIHGGSTTHVTLWIPRARILSSISDEHALHGLRLTGSSPAKTLISVSLLSLAELAGRMTVQEMDALADGVVELTARAITPIIANAATFGVPIPLASFVTIRRFIDRNLKSRALSPQTIAESFGLSRASLYRLFEPAGGIAGYIRERRLKQCYQEITAEELSNQRIGQIAYSYGFKNASAFSRLFREHYGVSPREARAVKLREIPSVILNATDEDGPSLATWLDQIR